MILRLVRLGLVLVLAGCQASSGKPAAGTDPTATVETESTRLQTERDAARARGDRDGEVAALLALGIAAVDRGDLRGAETLFRDALTLRESAVKFDDPSLGDPLAHLAVVASLAGRRDEADQLFGRAEAVLRTAKDPLDLARLQSYRAIDLARRGKLQEARTLAQSATSQRRDILSGLRGAPLEGPGRGYASQALVEMAQGLVVEASVALRQGESAAARQQAELARRIIADLPEAPAWWAARVDEVVALAELEAGDPAAAERRMTRALEITRRAFGESRPSALAYLTLGQVLDAAARPRQAVESGQRGVDLIVAGRGAELGIGSDRLLAFIGATLSLIESTPRERAALMGEVFEAAQLRRNVALDQTVAQMAARLGASDPALATRLAAATSAGQARDRLRIDLGREAARPAAERDAGLIERLRTAFLTADTQARRAEADLAATAPDYASLVSPRPTPIAEVQAVLRPGEAALQILLGSSGGAAVLLRADGQIQAVRLTLTRAAVETQVRRLREAFTPVNDRIAPFDMAAAYTLYQGLIAPLGTALTGVERLVVVVDGALASLPLGVLIASPPPAGEAYGAADWLATRMSFLYAPSLRALVGLRRLKPSAAPEPFLGFGGAPFLGRPASAAAVATAGCRSGRPMPPEVLRALAPLPGTSREVEQVAASLGGRSGVVLGAAMREAEMTSARLGRARILYFATHGLLPGELACQAEPALALAPPPSAPGSRAEDGLLEASEITALRLDADLVVLSACNTGSAGELGGDALSGLARAFLQAGARNLIVSHWVVESETAVAQMIALFASWRPEITPERLRAAQTQIKADPARAHPFFWAPFTVVGAG